jgi:putative peptide zinc metalloprotease protein
MTLGRAPGSTLQLADPTVSRTHARIKDGRLEDVGSSAGTYANGARVTGPVALRDGLRLRLGGVEVGVERRRDAAEAGRTIVVPLGASMVVSAAGSALSATATTAGFRPRARSGWALKRLDASEGPERWVLRDLESDKFLRLGDGDAELFERLDGRTSLPELIALAERRDGAAGTARVARLLADLGERGLLADVEGGEAPAGAGRGRLRRLVGPHVKAWRGVGRVFETVYARGGWVLFLRPVLLGMAALAVIGLGCFAWLVIKRYGTPFVVANKLGLGGLVFLAGRFAFAALHELAHGLTMASFGRRVDRAGLKAVLIFPYVFVDTSEAWFEPRRHRIAVSLAGPASDFTLGAVFAVLATVVEGTVRDVFFQLAFAAYVGALFNLNPFLDRDGYHVLVDLLREPGLRRRARAQFERRLRGDRRATDELALRRYSVAGAAWSLVGAGLAIVVTLRYHDVMRQHASEPVVWGVLGTVWAALFLPFVWTVVRPWVAGRRGRAR